VTELNQRMRENDGQAAALARRQDELAASFSARLTAFASSMVKHSRLRTCRRAFAQRAQGNITQQDYLALISRTTARQKNCRSWRKNRPQRARDSSAS
jgi:nitrogen fixation/metabolism regulation signal transduction histidine kinase